MLRSPFRTLKENDDHTKTQVIYQHLLTFYANQSRGDNNASPLKDYECYDTIEEETPTRIIDPSLIKIFFKFDWLNNMETIQKQRQLSPFRLISLRLLWQLKRLGCRSSSYDAVCRHLLFWMNIPKIASFVFCANPDGPDVSQSRCLWLDDPDCFNGIPKPP